MDDEPSNIVAMREVLSGLGAEIVPASSGREALRLVLQREFCAILMDVRMPDMDGYDTVAVIRERERSRRIPVIFLTAYDEDQAQVVRGYSEGAVDYVFKPVEPVVLRAKVSVFVELYKQSKEIQIKAEHEQRLLAENFRIRGERMEAERQLRSTEQREATVFRSLPIAVYEADLGGDGVSRTFLHDESVRRLLGFESGEFASDPALWAERVHRDDWAGVASALNGISPDGSYSVEYRWRCADGSYRYFLDQGIAAQVDGADAPRIFGTMFDVHDRRMLQQQLLHAQKIDAIGKLTGGIVHDFNNMLTVVIGNLDRVRRTETLDTRTARRVEHALQGALHCRDITQRLLGFARQQTVSARPVDLNALINSLSDLVSRTLGERVEIANRLASSLWHVHCDPSHIESALLNLLVNARDAMPDGGRVVIRTANVSIGDAAARPNVDLADGEYVVLEVSDSGVGMPKEVLDRACEPFFTTKDAGHGTGLGLSTIYGLVAQSGGGLGIESVPGEGTTVRIFLPRYETAAPSVDRASEGEQLLELPRAREGEVVLVVEDEETVRRTACNTLRELGYRVIEAGSAAIALDALGQTEEVRLLFTDVIMPGPTDGGQLAREARRRRPDLKILLTSAYGGEVLAQAGAQVAGAFLRKPYRDYELALAVRQAMD